MKKLCGFVIIAYQQNNEKTDHVCFLVGKSRRLVFSLVLGSTALGILGSNLELHWGNGVGLQPLFHPEVLTVVGLVLSGWL